MITHGSKILQLSAGSLGMQAHIDTHNNMILQAKWYMANCHADKLKKMTLRNVGPSKLACCRGYIHAVLKLL